MLLGRSHHLRSPPEHLRDRGTNSAISGPSRTSTPISHGNQLRQLTSSATLAHKLLYRCKRIATQIANELTFRRTWSTFDHVLLVPCQYIGSAQTQWRKESGPGTLPEEVPLGDSICEVAQTWEYLVACLGQCLALEVVPRRV